MKRVAPAGSVEALKAAVLNGAEVVYLGGKNFSARQNATNFDEQELLWAVEYAHLHGTLVYQAINTLIFDDQFKELADSARYAAKIGIDAIIVQDLGVAYYLKQMMPTMPLNVSTQLSIHSVQGAAAAVKLNFSQLVAARELEAKELTELCALGGLPVEAFIQGSLCMSVSGQCYASALIGSRSANRGLCGQACRLPFDGTHPLSLKDLSLIPYIGELSQMGVYSGKIEGRMKRPEYVAAAIKATEPENTEYYLELLADVFSRGGEFTDGFFTAKRDAAMFGYRQKDDVMAAKTAVDSIISEQPKDRRIVPLAMAVYVAMGEPVTLSARGITVTTDAPQHALSVGASLESAKKQLQKLGGTPYFLSEITGDIDPECYVSVAQWNGLRRALVDALNEIRLKEAHLGVTVCEDVPQMPVGIPREPQQGIFRAFCRTKEQLQAAFLTNHIEQYILPDTLITYAIELGISAENIWWAPPRFSPSDYSPDISPVTKVYASNIAHINVAGKICTAGLGMNITNSLAVASLSETFNVKEVEASFELKLNQIAHLTLPEQVGLGMTVYGYLPLMLTRVCPLKGKNNKVCDKKCSITDTEGRIFNVFPQDDYCSHLELLNCSPLWLADRMDEIRRIAAADFYILRFSTETAQDVTNIINSYVEQLPCDGEFTRGLYYRGIM